MNRKTIIMLFACLFTALCAGALIRTAFATNGAFPLVKHGGGTTDGNIPYGVGNNGPGVDRSVNPDYIGALWYYNDTSVEAGKYKAGECTQCHEPHASFGEAEPPPNATIYLSSFMSPGEAAGPDPYLTFGGIDATSASYSKLCWYCHENFSNINGSSSPLGMGRYSFYQGRTVYQAGSHYNYSLPRNTNMYWPGTTGDPVSIWPRKSRASLPSGNKGSCLNCHTPHGIKETVGKEFDTSAVPTSGTNLHLAANNPSVSADNVIPRQLIAWEEGLCFNCHDSDGPAINNIKSEIQKRTTGSGHPVDDTALAGRHSVREAIPITTKHVECYDCHNPHADQKYNRLEGMKYITVDGTVCDPASPSNPGQCLQIGSNGSLGSRTTAQPFIYEVCFKCHGNTYNQVFANDTPFPDVATNRNETTFPKHFSNKRKEFDPTSHQYANYPAGDIGYNTAYHPVVAPGRNGSYNLCMQLQNAFPGKLTCASAAVAAAELSQLTIQCTDCHNNDATASALTNPVTVSGPVTYSNLRTTDKAPAIASGNNDFGAAPIGPHGSINKKILRGNYLMVNSIGGGGFVNNYYFNNRLDTNGRPKFELCFQCHEESRLVGVSGSGGIYTYFGVATTTVPGPSGISTWSVNLHLYHLNVGAVCHDCHHNVHSNVEAQNTIYGDGLRGMLPPDNDDGITDGKIDTHLINFGPQATGATAVKPRWYYDPYLSGRYYRCNLACHGFNMSLCSYRRGTSGGCGGSPCGGGGWCQ